MRERGGGRDRNEREERDRGRERRLWEESKY